MSSMSHDIRQQLEDRQFNSTYDGSKFLIVDIEFGGFGAMIARRKLGLQLGTYFGRCVLFNFKSHVYDDPFFPVSSFDMNSIKNEQRTALDFTLTQKDKVVHFDFDSYWNNKSVLKEFHEKTVGGLDFRHFSGILLNFLRLKPEYSEFIDQKYHKIGISHISSPVLGVHIRRGDKEIESPFIPIEKYVSVMDEILDRMGSRTIFLCSDDSSVMEQVSASMTDVCILYDEEEVRYDSKVNNIYHVTSSKKKQIQESMTGMKIIELLSRCSAILGQNNVQFPKLAGCKLIDKTNNAETLTLIDPFTHRLCKWDNHLMQYEADI